METLISTGLKALASGAGSDDAILPLGERVPVAISNLILGMLVVFAVLTLLCVIITLVGKFFASRNKIASAKVAEAVTPSSEQLQETATEDNDSEIVAAITAAISVYLEAEGKSDNSFRVISFRKTTARSSWNNK